MTPELGSRWRAKGLRHTWTVTKVGHRYVWLKSNYPGGKPLRVDKGDVARWMEARMTPMEIRIYNACPTVLRPLLLVAGDVWSMIRLGREWGH